ncbi:hypothetical protein ACP70R_004377 [Stipagrostis hirtigluma subsp. patula]
MSGPRICPRSPPPSAPSMPTMMVQSAAMRRLRRELESSRRMPALAAKGGVAKKPSSPPPRRPAPTPPDPSRDHGVAKKPSSSSASCTRRAAAPAETADLKSFSIGKGAQVRVRTPVGTLRTGQRLVLWLGAVVVSAADEEDGYLHVVYNNAKLPREDPSGVVRVSMNDVKNMPPAAAAALSTDGSTGSSAVTTTDCSAHPSQRKATPRPTVAGKKLPLLKKLEKEMQNCSNAITSCW